MGIEYIELSVEFVHETEKAVLVDDAGSKVWIPKSLLDGWEDNARERGDVVEVSVPEWFAEKEGMI